MANGLGRILIVDDLPANLQLLSLMLQRLGYAAVAVNNGLEAIHAHSGELFSAILMDCQMPDLDGFQATALIRASEARLARRTPIIAVTANAQADDRARCFDVGMDDFIAKPVRLHELRGVLARWLPVTEAGCLAVRSA